MQISEFHEAAIQYAEAGYPVFPCLPHSKAPACEGGFKAATRDVETINRWWTECPNYNVAFSPQDTGMAVIEVEVGAVGEYEKLQIEEQLPETYTIRSPRGGFHFYFRGELPSTVKKLAPHIDTRGKGGYVLLPPSYVRNPAKGIDGAYTVVNDDLDIADLPPNVIKRFHQTIAVAADPNADNDSPGNIYRATSYLQSCAKAGDVSNEGEGGDNRLYQACATVRSLGISPEISADLIEQHWNPHCNPPWSRDEIEIKCRNAAEYAQNGLGAFAAPVTAEAFKEALDKLPKEPAPSRGRFHSWDDDDMNEPYEERWIMPGVLPDASTILLYGPTQSYKSFVALELALAVATGSKSFGVDAEPGPVFYGALEGRFALMHKRRPAWRIAHGFTGSSQLYVMPAPLMISDDEQVEFVEEIRRRAALLGKRPRLIILDTVSKMMVGLDPNRDAPLLVRFCDRLVAEFSCSVIAVHHSGKDTTLGPRDSSVYRADFDCVLEVTSPAKLVCEVKVVKFKDAEEPEHPFQFELAKVGPSLVLQSTTYKHEPRGLAAVYTAEAVTVALKHIGAIDHNSAVGANVLAAEMTPRLPSDTEPTFAQNCATTQKALSRLANGALKDFTTKRGPRDRVWHLPANGIPESDH